EQFKGDMGVQKNKVLEAIENPDCGYFYETSKDNFAKIPGMPIAYWLGTNFVSKFAEKAIRNISVSKAGIVSGNDALFLKNWYEINDFNITYDAENFKNRMKYKWIPINKGGTFRKWYGNTEQIINI